MWMSYIISLFKCWVWVFFKFCNWESVFLLLYQHFPFSQIIISQNVQQKLIHAKKSHGLLFYYKVCHCGQPKHCSLYINVQDISFNGETLVCEMSSVPAANHIIWVSVSVLELVTGILEWHHPFLELPRMTQMFLH